MYHPLLSAALQNRLKAGWKHCSCTCEDLLFTQVCNDLTSVHCNADFCEMHSPELSAALQKRLTAGLHHCNYTHEDLLIIQV